MGGNWPADQIAKTTVSELLDKFHRELHTYHHRYWFKDHYYNTFGLDVTAHPFDFAKKFLHLTHTWNNRHLEIIILRLEDSHEWENILRPFFPTMKLLSSNEGSDKAYASKYAEFMTQVQYTAAELDILSHSESMLKFYTEEERNEFIHRALSASARLEDTTSE